MKKILLVFLLIGFSSFASAAGQLDVRYIQSIMSKAPTWSLIILPMASKIFIIAWAFETFWQCASHHLFDLTRLKELFRFLAVRIIFMSAFTALLINPSLYLGIMQLFTKLGSAGMGHIEGSSVNGIGIDPGWIWTQYTQWWTNDYTKAMNAIPWDKFGDQLGLAIGSLIYMACTIYISFLIILMDVEAILIIYGAVILTGFAGSKWTKQWWHSYLSMCVGMGLRILIFCLMYGVLQSVLVYHSGGDANIQDVDVWTLIVTTVLATLCLGIVPGKIGGAISSAAGGGGELAALGAGAAAMVSKLADGGLSLAQKAAPKVANTIKGQTNKIMDDLMKEHGKGSLNNKSKQPMADQGAKLQHLSSQNGASNKQSTPNAMKDRK